MSELDRAGRSDGRVSVAIPSEITRRAHRAIKIGIMIVSVILPMSLAFILLTGPQPNYDHTSIVEAARYRADRASYVFPLMILFGGTILLMKFLLLRPIAIRLSNLVGATTQDDELRVAVRKRLSRSYFIYGAKGVPRPMRSIRLSAKANTDGTYWKMTTDAKFTTLSFQKYHAGEIREPNNPDLPSVHNLRGTNSWTDIL